MIVRVYDFLSAEKPKFSQNLVGIVSDVTSFKYTRRAYDIGSFEMVIPTHADETECIQPDRMLIVGEKLSETYITSDPQKRIVVGTFLYVTDIEKKDDSITITGYDLKYLFALRVTLFPKEEQDKGTYGYYVTKGTTFHCVSDIVNYNVVTPTDESRKIYGMYGITMPYVQTTAEPPLTGIQDDRYMTRLEPVSTAIFNLLKNCKTHFYDMRLVIDDRVSESDNYNPHMESSEDKPTIIIDESRYNIKSYTRKDGTSAYKNAIYAVVGNGDDVTVKCVKRSDDTASGIKRKEVALDVDADDVSEIDRYALKAAEEYAISDDFEIEPLFADDEEEPSLAQKVSIRIDGAEYETVITEITDEYKGESHTQTYVCGDKKLKVLNVLNKATAGNTQKIINNKIATGNRGGVGKTCGDGTSEQFNDYSTADIDDITRYSHIAGRNNTIIGGDCDTVIGEANTIKDVLPDSEKGYDGTRKGHGSVVLGSKNTTIQPIDTIVSGTDNYVGRSYWNSANRSIVVGSNNKIYGGMSCSAVIGYSNVTPSSENTDVTSLSGSLVFGGENKIESGDIVASIIIGDGNNAKLRDVGGARKVKNSMQNSVMIGTGNINEAVQGAYTIGHFNHQYSSTSAVITGKGQFAIGVGLENGRPNNFVMGYYNKKYDEHGNELDLPFSFGGGTSDDDRKNLIELDHDGNMHIAGKFTADGNLHIAGSLTADGGIDYDIPIATFETVGGIKVGSDFEISEDGTLTVVKGSTLPIATSNTLGGVIVGTGLKVNDSGQLSADLGNGLSTDSNGKITSDYGNRLRAGIVQIGGGIELQPGGLISVPIATKQSVGLVKPGDGIAIDANGTISTDVYPPASLFLSGASKMMLHKYIPVESKKQGYYYGSVASDIICDTNKYYSSAPNFPQSYINIPNWYTSTSTSTQAVNNAAFELIETSIDNSTNTIKIKVKCDALSYTSSVYTAAYFSGTTIYLKWKSINAPADKFQYGYIVCEVHLYYYDNSNGPVDRNLRTGYIPFASKAEYNAAICLTATELPTFDLSEEKYTLLVPNSLCLLTGELPTPSLAEEGVIYLTPNEQSTAFKQYMWNGSEYKYLGETDRSTDLSEYLKSDEISDWAKAEEKPTYTAEEVGAAEKEHTHTRAQITDFPTALPANGGNADTVDGKHASDLAAAKHTHTAAEVGAAAKSHTHTKSQITDFPALGTAAEKNVSDFYPAKAKSVLGLDYNDLISNGIFELQGTADNPTANTPNGSHTNNNFYVQVFYRNPKYITQIATSVRGDKTRYIRSLNNGTWNDWEKIKSGDADTVDGKHASDLAAADHTHTAIEQRIKSLEARVAALEAAAVSGGEV